MQQNYECVIMPVTKVRRFQPEDAPKAFGGRAVAGFKGWSSEKGGEKVKDSGDS